MLGVIAVHRSWYLYLGSKLHTGCTQSELSPVLESRSAYTRTRPSVHCLEAAWTSSRYSGARLPFSRLLLNRLRRRLNYLISPSTTAWRSASTTSLPQNSTIWLPWSIETTLPACNCVTPDHRRIGTRSTSFRNHGVGTDSLHAHHYTLLNNHTAPNRNPANRQTIFVNGVRPQNSYSPCTNTLDRLLGARLRLQTQRQIQNAPTTLEISLRPAIDPAST